MPIYRIDKILSDMGLASRRQAKVLIDSGRVTVNGEQISRPETKCNTDIDLIVVDGNILQYERYIYLMLNKPSGVICATEDDRTKTVIDLLDDRSKKQKLFPVGRLDKDTEGLLILTNDGSFGHKVASPRHGVVKKYYLETENKIAQTAIEIFQKGLELKSGIRCLPAKLEILSQFSAHLSISEGKYHQVKKMMAEVGSPVKYLKRISIGGLELDNNLMPGKYRKLTEQERINIIKNNFNLS